VGDQVSKEVDQWLGQVSTLLKAHKVAGDESQMLTRSVEHVLKGIGVGKLQSMDEAAVLSAVRDGLPNAPVNMLRPEWIAQNSDLVAQAVDKFFAANKIRSGGLKTLGDGVVNELEARIAEYLAKLPTDVTVKREGLTLVLSKEGVAAKIQSGGVSADAKLQGTENKIQVDTKDLKLAFESKGTSLKFDGTLKHTKKDLELLVELHARQGKFTEGDAESTAIEAKIDATYKEVRLQTDASLKQIHAKIEYLKKNTALKELSVELQSDYDKFQAKLKLAYEKKDTKVLVQAIAEGNKLETKLNVTTITKGGLNVNAEVKATLERVDAKLELFRKNKSTDLKFLATLESDYKDLKAKAELVYKSSGDVQVELIAKFEATLDRVRASIEASVKADTWSLTAGAGIDTQGLPTGKLEALVKLGEGFQIMGQNAYLKVGADVNDKRWSVFVGISLTNPPKASDVNKLIRSAESNVNSAYGIIGDKSFDAADSAKILSEMQNRLKVPPPKIGLEAGFFLSDDIPQANMPNLPMVGGVGLKITWF
jgi:hypothetical protein